LCEAKWPRVEGREARSQSPVETSGDRLIVFQFQRSRSRWDSNTHNLSEWTGSMEKLRSLLNGDLARIRSAGGAL